MMLGGGKRGGVDDTKKGRGKIGVSKVGKEVVFVGAQGFISKI